MPVDLHPKNIDENKNIKQEEQKEQNPSNELGDLTPFDSSFMENSSSDYANSETLSGEDKADQNTEANTAEALTPFDSTFMEHPSEDANADALSSETLSGAALSDEDQTDTSSADLADYAHNDTASTTTNDAADADDGDDDDEPEEAHDKMSLLGHLRELKKRLLRSFMAIGVGFLACYSVSEELFNLLVQPLLKVLPAGSKLIYTGLPEAFFTYMKVAFVAGCFVASPIVFYQIWAFIGPGLYDEEKRHVLPVAFFSAFFFILGGAFAYFIAFPFAFEFFMSYSTGIIEAQPKVDEYLSFTLQLLFAFGLVFEMPLFTFFLSKMGLVTATGMRKVRRYAVLANFVAAAILTPPDVMSQMLMAAPLLLLYEFSILVAQAFGRKPKEPEITPDPETTPEASTA